MESGIGVAVRREGLARPVPVVPGNPGVLAIESKSRPSRLTLEQSDGLDTPAGSGVPVVAASSGNYDETIATVTPGMQTK